MPTKPLIKVNQVTKIYQSGPVKTVALSGVSFSVNRGEFVAIMGPSGSGKSTLMHILGALDKPTEGNYLLEGVNVETLNDNQLAEIRNQKIGFVFQAYNLLPRTTALKNVMLPMIYADIPFKQRLTQASRLLTDVGLQDRLNYISNQLSGGQQQRVAIARALAMNPSILLADEPTGNVASVQADEIMNIFSDLHHRGHTVIMITHDPDIAKYAKRVITIRDGQVVNNRKQ
jgi:putative ABC transport system ATP-binding protein